MVICTMFMFHNSLSHLDYHLKVQEIMMKTMQLGEDSYH